MQQQPLVSLADPGSTAYLVPVYLLLYHTPEVKRQVFVLDLQALGADPNSNEFKILAALKELFLHIHQHTADKVDHSQLSGLLGYQQTGFNQQGDCLENFLIVIDRIAAAFKKVGFPEEFASCYLFTLLNTMLCNNCGSYKEKPQPSNTISLSIRQTQSVTEGIQQFCTVENIDDYHCSECKKSVKLDKGLKVGKVNQELILVGQRFEFDFDSMSMRKLHKKHEFPMILDIHPLTKQNKGDPLELYAVLAHKGEQNQGSFELVVRDILSSARDKSEPAETDAGTLAEITEANRHVYSGWFRFRDDQVQAVPASYLKTLQGDGVSKLSYYFLLYRLASQNSQNEALTNLQFAA